MSAASKPKCTSCAKRPQTIGKICTTCYSRAYYAKHPILRIYNNLKSNAKRRGKEFKISFEYFKKLCIKSGYHELRGRQACCFSIDRKENHLGYVEGNLQILTVSDNAAKRDMPIKVEGIYTDAEITF